MRKTLASVGLMVWASACVRVVGPSPADASAPVALVVERLSLESTPLDGGPTLLLGYGGGLLTVEGRGFDPALVSVRLQNQQLQPVTVDAGMATAGMDGGTVTVVVALPLIKVEGPVVLVQDGRQATSVQHVAVLGPGHPPRAEFVGNTDPQFTIFRAGGRGLSCPAELGCPEELTMPGAVALAFGVTSGVLLAPEFHVAVLGLFGATEQLGTVGGMDLGSHVTALWPYTNPFARRGTPQTGVALHRYATYEDASRASEVRNVSFSSRDGGVLSGAASFVVPVSTAVGLTAYPLPDGRLGLLVGVLPLPVVLNPPVAVGATHPGIYSPSQAQPELVWLECDPQPDAFQVTLRHVAWANRDAGFPVRGETHQVPRRLGDGGACDLLDPAQQPACVALAQTGGPELVRCAVDSDGGCCDLLDNMASCVRDESVGGCRDLTVAVTACYTTPACLDALANYFQGDQTACLSNVACARAATCVNTPRCADAVACGEEPGCAAAFTQTPPSCQEVRSCLGISTCRDHALCDRLGCAATNTCLNAMCQRDSVDQLLPLSSIELLHAPVPAEDEFFPAPQPACAVNLEHGVPRLLADDVRGAAVVVGFGTKPRLMTVLGISRTLALFDLDSSDLTLASARTRYRQLVSTGVAELVFGIPEEGPRVDLLNGDGVLVSSQHVLAIPLSAYALPAQDGRILSFHSNHVVLADNAGNVLAMRYFPQNTFTPQPPAVAGAPPAAVWAVVPEPDQTQLRLEQVVLNLEGLVEPLPRGQELGSPVPRGLLSQQDVSTLAAVVAFHQDTLYVTQCANPTCATPTLGRVAVLSGRDTLTVQPVDIPPSFLVALDGTFNVGLAQRYEGEDTLSNALLVNLDNDGESDLVVRNAHQDTVVSLVTATPAPGGGFVVIAALYEPPFANVRAVVGWISPGANGVMDILAPADTLASSVTVSPDGQRVYVGRFERITELSLSRDTTMTPPRTFVVGTRAIDVDGRPNTMAMDSEGTRLVFTDWEKQTVGLLE